MFLLPLVLALQSQPTIRATPADSALARATLRAGLAAFDSVSTDPEQQLTLNRYLEQLLVWNMKDEGGETALRIDRAWTSAWRVTSMWAAYWLWLMLEADDTLSAERFIAFMPPAIKDMQMVVAGQLLLSGIHFPPFKNNLPRALWLESRITRPTQRAELMASRAQLSLTSDWSATRLLLRQAIQLSRTDTAGMWSAWKWMITLVKRGDQIPLDSIVHAAIYAQGDLWTARRAVADELSQRDFSHLTRRFTDIARRERVNAVSRPESRIAIHFLRATSRDSSRAWAILDSLDAVSTARMTAVPPLTAAERAARNATGTRALAQLQVVELMSRNLLGWRPRYPR